MSVFYNERDPYAAEWLRNLIAAGHIAPGVVSEEDIRDLRPADLAEFTQCHFFAGIGVWSHALRKAGWADDRPVWTGSCPCQPFSAAGRRAGVADERHLWPHWHWLIDQCRPAIVLGEQVASKDGLGWLDLVSADLEGSGYAVGASDLCAAGFGGAHIRQRLYFVGMADAAHQQQHWRGDAGQGRRVERADSGGTSRMADASALGRQGASGGSAAQEQRATELLGAGGMADADGGHAGAERKQSSGQHGCEPQDGRDGRSGDSGARPDADRELARPRAPMLGRHPADWLFCRDGKFRPVEPGTFPLAHAAPARVGRLRAYGNALDAETAAGFVGAVMEAIAAPLVAPEPVGQLEMFGKAA